MRYFTGKKSFREKVRNIFVTAALATIVATAGYGPSAATEAWAHGTRLEYEADITIHVRAAYDTQEPMDGGHFFVFKPGASEPWLEGQCDDDGRFSFTPDRDVAGTYVVQVQHTGHGATIDIPVGDSMPLKGVQQDVSSLQKAVMIGSVLWGFVGTALYFSRRKDPLPQGGKKDAHS
ncbi:carboxypeptidase regulatory-like domain-containing protein [Heliorestis convoluta]|uniref:Carboxypeptidase regulatory-like domain-containing protein n=1 Tax=Heliorestis convoluta TaxID=356322 RepID=A0A5Q2MVK2_9FIRM|nr:carboxypeptidase regulatory-like domain-containing protein [Heliorestis convoluta]QGG46244.1 hypothetical protein FTV88_0065 [Heliorestis convoluta]